MKKPDFRFAAALLALLLVLSPLLAWAETPDAGEEGGAETTTSASVTEDTTTTLPEEITTTTTVTEETTTVTEETTTTTSAAVPEQTTTAPPTTTTTYVLTGPATQATTAPAAPPVSASTASTSATTAPTGSATAPVTPRPTYVKEKSFVFSVMHDVGSFSVSPTVAAFWEYPMLRAGETAPDGTLTVLNNSSYTADITFAGLTLPYEDEEQLRYLNALYLTVWDGETVLYDGQYVHAADAESGLRLPAMKLASGESKQFRIRLRCALEYGGETEAAVQWHFSSSLTQSGVQKVETKPNYMQFILIATGVMVVGLAVLGFIRMRVGRSEKEETE